ncbi:Hypothetical protein AA314_08861 [Archangium gephyra]|uniref:Uncharacterized protein n=1 Tax=Archangium gephyra TaxID=48 RepID=A0AAC8QHJ1_9BACT|nr:Hypothetical protein AA314_08861 [Archangium gephyra]
MLPGHGDEMECVHNGLEHFLLSGGLGLVAAPREEIPRAVQSLLETREFISREFDGSQW